MSESMRTEKDSMGEMRVPADAYYGASTARAVDNFRGLGGAYSVSETLAQVSRAKTRPAHGPAHRQPAPAPPRSSRNRR